MELLAIRSLGRSRLRAIRRAFLSALGMAAIVLGLLAMHSSGAEHIAAAEPPVAASFTGHAGASPAAAVAATPVLLTAVTTAVQCDEVCAPGAMECALMVMACAMVLAVAAFIVFAHRPGMHRKLVDTGCRVIAALPPVPLQILRPDLVVLSISRT